MKLKVYKRSLDRKCEVKEIRREGNIPAVLYSKGQTGENVFIDGTDFRAAVRHLASGRLPATLFTLTGEDGSERTAIVKDVQYQVTSYDVLHLDLVEVFDEVPVTLNVPIEFTGVADCQGIKIGGVLRAVIRHLKVKCLPKNIPNCFELDVRKLGLKQSLRLANITIPGNVTPLADLNEVAVVIAKR